MDPKKEKANKTENGIPPLIVTPFGDIVAQMKAVKQQTMTQLLGADPDYPLSPDSIPDLPNSLPSLPIVSILLMFCLN